MKSSSQIQHTYLFVSILLSLQVTEIQMYCQPAQASNQVRVQSELSAISQGDMHWACLLRLQYCNYAVWVGPDLSLVSEVIISIYVNLYYHFRDTQHYLSISCFTRLRCFLSSKITK